jgi:gluconolactonase
MKQNIIISDLNFPEGPVFDSNGNLWFAEIEGGNLSFWNGKELARFDIAGTPNGTMIDKSGNIWFCDSRNGAIRVFHTADQSINILCTETTGGEKLKRPNDLIFDKSGNLLFSDHADGRDEPLSTLCVLPKGKTKAKIISRRKYFTNGLALNSQGNKLVFSETYRQQLWIGVWDNPALELRDERPFAKAGNGPWGPDGIAYDENEDLFVAVFNESRINIYDKDGQLAGYLPCPGNRPTSCAFDPSGKLGLVVTEAENGQVISYPELGRGLSIFYG